MSFLTSLSRLFGLAGLRRDVEQTGEAVKLSDIELRRIKREQASNEARLLWITAEVNALKRRKKTDHDGG